MMIGDLVRVDTQVFLFGFRSADSQVVHEAGAFIIASAEKGEIVLTLSLLPDGWAICTFPSGQTGFAKLSNC